MGIKVEVNNLYWKNMLPLQNKNNKLYLKET